MLHPGPALAHPPCPCPPQLLYPEPPRAVWGTASAATQARVAPWMKSRALSEDALEERLT